MTDDDRKLPGLKELFGKVQQFQQRMEAIQQELGSERVEAEAGGGMVSAVANGRREVVSVRIEPELMGAEDREMLQDLVVAAVNAALVKAEQMTKEKMEEQLGGITGGMLPNLFG